MIWLVMQAGTVGVAPVAGAVAWASGRPALGKRLVVSGVLSWALSKAIKRVYRRPRPGSLVRGTRPNTASTSPPTVLTSSRAKLWPSSASSSERATPPSTRR